MSETRLFHIGPQKTATTWIYECLKKHPDICTSARDTIHYFDVNYHKGRSWYDDQFTLGSGSCFFDPTYTYLRTGTAAKRIAQDFPNARFIFNLRHPIDRAFSHYWHERKKGNVSYNFDDIISNYDLFKTWLVPGLYAEMLSPYLEHFNVEAILPLKIEDIEKNPHDCLSRIYDHAKIAPDYFPDIATQTINASGAKQNIINRGFLKIGNILTDGQAAKNPFWRMLGGIENQNDIISDDLYAELMAICLPDIIETENIFNIDLSAWKI